MNLKKILLLCGIALLSSNAVARGNFKITGSQDSHVTVNTPNNHVSDESYSGERIHKTVDGQNYELHGNKQDSDSESDSATRGKSTINLNNNSEGTLKSNIVSTLSHGDGDN